MPYRLVYKSSFWLPSLAGGRSTCLYNRGLCNHETRCGPKPYNSHSFSEFRSQAKASLPSHSSGRTEKFTLLWRKGRKRGALRKRATPVISSELLCAKRSNRDTSLFEGLLECVRLSTLRVRRPCGCERLRRLKAREPERLGSLVPELLRTWQSGGLKLYVTAKSLGFRARPPSGISRGD
jgi:hypothetical protein